MKYFFFSAIFSIALGFIFALLSPHEFRDSALAGDAFAQGVGWGIGSLLFGCIGLLFKRNRFQGFMVASCVFSVLGVIGSMQH